MISPITWENAHHCGEVHNEVVRKLLKLSGEPNAALPPISDVSNIIAEVFFNHTSTKINPKHINSYVERHLEVARQGVSSAGCLPAEVSDIIDGFMKIRSTGSSLEAKCIDIPSSNVILENTIRLGLAVAEASEKHWIEYVVSKAESSNPQNTKIIFWTSSHTGVDLSAMAADDANSAAWDYYNKVFSWSYWSPGNFLSKYPGEGIIDSAIAGAIQSHAGYILGMYNVIIQPQSPGPPPPPGPGA